MRIFLLAATAALCFVFYSCENKVASADNDLIQQNLKATRIVSEAFGSGDVSKIDSVVAEDYLDHTDRGDIRGRDSLKAMIHMVHNNFKDMKADVLHELADSNYVYTWMRFTGQSDGAMGMPAGPYDMKALQLNKLRNGKIVEHWEFMEVAEMMKMMGQMPSPPQPDTSKKK
jgi:predicted SnoaL-like aldol condensation-catalyzing enzyme